MKKLLKDSLNHSLDSLSVFLAFMTFGLLLLNIFNTTDATLIILLLVFRDSIFDILKSLMLKFLKYLQQKTNNEQEATIINGENNNEDSN